MNKVLRLTLYMSVNINILASIESLGLKKVPFKGALCSFGEEIQTLFYIYSINEVIIQTLTYLSSP